MSSTSLGSRGMMSESDTIDSPTETARHRIRNILSSNLWASGRDYESIQVKCIEAMATLLDVPCGACYFERAGSVTSHLGHLLYEHVKQQQDVARKWMAVAQEGVRWADH